MDPVRQHTGEPAEAPTTLRVHPGADGVFTLYDDDGVGLGYKDGSDAKAIWLRMRWDDARGRLRIEADERMKRWPGSARSFRVEKVGSAAAVQSVEFRGEPVDVQL
jgi:hypothetical protein